MTYHAFFHSNATGHRNLRAGTASVRIRKCSPGLFPCKNVSENDINCVIIIINTIILLYINIFLAYKKKKFKPRFV